MRRAGEARQARENDGPLLALAAVENKGLGREVFAADGDAVRQVEVDKVARGIIERPGTVVTSRLRREKTPQKRTEALTRNR